MKKFEIKCNKCGNTEITFIEYDDYDIEEKFCGSHYLLRCENCNEEEFLDLG